MLPFVQSFSVYDALCESGQSQGMNAKNYLCPSKKMEMNKEHYAAIDVGSNAVRLLIKCVNSEEAEEPLSKVLLLRVPLRLGEDSFNKGYIGEEKTDNMIRLMRAYSEMMKIYRVRDYRACATSAMRDASNGKELVGLIREETGIAIDIIDGDEEARLVSDNNIERLIADGANYLYLDVGGGSTELTLFSQSEVKHSHSFNIGTVRLLSGKVQPETWAAFCSELETITEQYTELSIIGTGGNINRLVRLSGSDRGSSRYGVMPVEALRNTYELLKPISTEERMVRFHLKPDRADVIIPAAEIFLKVADITGARNIIAPVIGLADGIVEDLYMRHQPKLS